MHFDDLVRRQSGVFSRDQARACGVSPRALRGRVARGVLTEVAPGVYRSRSHRASDENRIVAASLWAGPTAVLDGPAAAWVHRMLSRLPGTRIPVGVTLPAAARRTAPTGIRVRRRDVDPRDRCRRDGMGVTAKALTALETAIVLPDGSAFLDRALQTGLPFEELRAAFNRAVGSAGAPQARALLVEAADRADSRAERRLIGHLRAAGIGGFVRALPFAAWHIDIAFPAARLAIEVDGWAFHSDPERFRTDRRKQNALVAAGWTVLRFTWLDIRDHPGPTVDRIRRSLRRA